MLIIRKKHIIIGLLVVLLIITGYLNFIYNQNALSTMTKEVNNYNKKAGDSESSKNNSRGTDTDNSNDNVLSVSSSNFFRDYRFEREHIRQDEIGYINKIIDNPESKKEIVEEAQKQLLELTTNMENEMAIETLIKAKGFDDVIAIINNRNISVIVDKPELEPDEVAQILHIVTRQTGEMPENIKIIPKI